MNEERRSKTTKRYLVRQYQRLLKHFGPQHWWPGETQLEIIVGAILTQNTAWINVEKAISSLKASGCLQFEKLLKLKRRRLEQLIRPSGFFRQKAERLQDFLRFVGKKYQGNLTALFQQETPVLRQELLAQKGIGPETADSILLYAAGKPVFVVDAYTKRIGRRWRIFETEDYSAIQNFFQDHLPRRTKLYNEWHALIVALGKNFCKPKPLCAPCPVKEFCLFGRNHGG